MNATSHVSTQSAKLDNVISYNNDDNDHFITDGDDGDDYGDSRIVDDNTSQIKDHKRSHNKKHSIPETVPKITPSTSEDGEFLDTHTTPVKSRSRPSTKLKGGLNPTPTPPPTLLKFKSKSTGRTYLLPNPDSNNTIRPNAFTSWCFKVGKWLDSRKNHYPNPKYSWSPTLESEHIDYLTIVILDDKEIKLIDRALCGRRGEGVTEYEHLTEVCNLEKAVVRAYVKLGNEVEGYPDVDGVAVEDLNKKEKTPKESNAGDDVETFNKKMPENTTENKPIEETTAGCVVKPTRKKKSKETTIAGDDVVKPRKHKKYKKITGECIIKPPNNSKTPKETTADAIVDPTNKKEPDKTRVTGDAVVKTSNKKIVDKTTVDDAVNSANRKRPDETTVGAVVYSSKYKKMADDTTVDAAIHPANKKMSDETTVEAVVVPTNKKKSKEIAAECVVKPTENYKRLDETTTSSVIKPTENKKPEETTSKVDPVENPSNEKMVNVAIEPAKNKNSVKDILDAVLKLANINKTPQGPTVGSAAVKPNKNNEKSERITTYPDATSTKKKSEGTVVDDVVKPTEKTKSSGNAVAGGVLPIQKKKNTQGVEKSTNKEKQAEEANKRASSNEKKTETQTSDNDAPNVSPTLNRILVKDRLGKKVFLNEKTSPPEGQKRIGIVVGRLSNSILSDYLQLVSTNNNRNNYPSNLCYYCQWYEVNKSTHDCHITLEEAHDLRVDEGVGDVITSLMLSFDSLVNVYKCSIGQSLKASINEIEGYSNMVFVESMEGTSPLIR